MHRCFVTMCDSDHSSHTGLTTHLICAIIHHWGQNIIHHWGKKKGGGWGSKTHSMAFGIQCLKPYVYRLIGTQLVSGSTLCRPPSFSQYIFHGNCFRLDQPGNPVQLLFLQSMQLQLIVTPPLIVTSLLHSCTTNS